VTGLELLAVVFEAFVIGFIVGVPVAVLKKVIHSATN
jgi:hypothetical protein